MVSFQDVLINLCVFIGDSLTHFPTHKIRDIWRPGRGSDGTRDSRPQIRDIPGKTGRLATLPTCAAKTLYFKLD